MKRKIVILQCVPFPSPLHHIKKLF